MPSLFAPRFTVSRLSGWVWRLSDAFVSCHLVLEDDGFTLVDCGRPGGGEAIIAIARALGFPIRRLLITHAHLDHSGSLDELARLLPGLEIIAGRREAPILAEDFTPWPDEPQKPVKGGFGPHRARPGRLLDDGERVGRLLAVFTPGHTPGHMSYLDVHDGILLTGDALATAGGLDVAGLSGTRLPFMRFLTWDHPLAVESARKLARLPVRVISSGHGQPLLSAQPSLEAAVSRAEAAVARRAS